MLQLSWRSLLETCNENTAIRWRGVSSERRAGEKAGGQFQVQRMRVALRGGIDRRRRRGCEAAAVEKKQPGALASSPEFASPSRRAEVLHRFKSIVRLEVSSTATRSSIRANSAAYISHQVSSNFCSVFLPVTLSVFKTTLWSQHGRRSRNVSQSPDPFSQCAAPSGLRE